MAHLNGRVADSDSVKWMDGNENGVHSDDPRGGTGGDASTGGAKKLPCLQRFSEFVIGSLETGFAKLGMKIGLYPGRFMVVSVLLSSLTSLGLLSFKEETESEKLWVPADSKVVGKSQWTFDYFPAIVTEHIIGEAPNILKKAQILALFAIYKESFTLQTSRGEKLSCAKDASKNNCMVGSILEIWSNNETTINALTDAQILLDIKTTTVSPVSNKPFNAKTYLGDIGYDANGDIASAKLGLISWMNDDWMGKIWDWEDAFLSMGRRGHADLSNTYVWLSKSLDKEAGNGMNDDIVYLATGFLIVVIFVFTSLGNFNFLEQRIWLTVGCFVCICLSILISVGLSSAFKQDWGVIQAILPFLLLGIGVDSVFVIMAALTNIPPEEQLSCDVPQLTSKVLAHAGVSITVTSITDFVAFLVGANTVIPALRSFCIYAAIGILALYFLQIIFFTACLSVDISRIRAGRDGCFCCIKHGDDYETNKCSQKQFVPYVFEKVLAPWITKLPVKIVVIIVTLALFGVNVWGVVELKQYFNEHLLIPDDSYAAKFRDIHNKHFPSFGEVGYIYCGQLPYYTLRTELDKMNDLMTSSHVIKSGSIDSWFEVLTVWLKTTTDASVRAKVDSVGYPTSNTNFENLTHHLITVEVPRISSHVALFPNLTILGSRFKFEYISLDGAEAEISAMDETFGIVKRAGLTTYDCYPYAKPYVRWEINKIIKDGLYKNLAYAMIGVFLVGLILIANIMTTFLVFIGVIFTLVDVAGTMHFWNLTIDIVTSVILILAIGLAVEYSAHIGHMFMRVKGTRKERVEETVREIGPPVFFGGFGTFLAFVLLANSNNYISRTFFKVNFLVVVYGLFHGLIFLPVILSLVGPDPYPNATLECKNNRNNSTTVIHSDVVKDPSTQEGKE